MNRSEVLRIVYLLWMAIFGIWAIASLWVKRTTESSSDASSRIAIWAVTIAWWLVLRPGTWQGVRGIRFVPEGAPGLYAGFGLTIVGVAFAVWSRFYIGKNWDGMVVLKEDHQLMRSGPYGIVRNPIYSGFTLATLGAAMSKAKHEAAKRRPDCDRVGIQSPDGGEVSDCAIRRAIWTVPAPSEGAGPGGLVRGVLSTQSRLGHPSLSAVDGNVKHAIETGALRKGDQLPAMRKLAEDLVMNPK